MQIDGLVCVQEAEAQVGEGPVWAERESALYWTDIYEGRLHRLDVASGRSRHWQVKDKLGSFALAEGGGFVAALHSAFAYLDVERARLAWLAHPIPSGSNTYLNDGRCDRSGRFYWAGSVDRSRTEKGGSLYRLAGDGSWKRMAGEVISSNGIAFSPDNRVLYYADSRGLAIWRFDHDPATGDISNRSLFAAIPPDEGFADGAAVDAEGFYWSARVFGGRILRYRPDGTIDRDIVMPFRNPTMVAFGGPDLRTLYITTARRTLTPEEAAEQRAGSVFAMPVDVAGLPEPRFRIDPALRARADEPIA